MIENLKINNLYKISSEQINLKNILKNKKNDKKNDKINDKINDKKETHIQPNSIQEEKITLAGGHHKNFWLSKDGKTIFKKTKPNEVEFYEEMMRSEGKLELLKIIPKCISISKKDNVVQLENLNYNMINPNIIDIKIGTHSFSGRKYPGINGYFDGLKRQARWLYRDIQYGFRKRGYRVQGCSWIEKDKQDRADIGIKSNNYINDFIKRSNITNEDKIIIVEQLKEISKIIQDSNYGFINSSVMIVADGIHRPIVKFIDFAHPIKFKNEKDKINSNYNKGPVKGAKAIAEQFEIYKNP